MGWYSSWLYYLSTIPITQMIFPADVVWAFAAGLVLGVALITLLILINQ